MTTRSYRGADEDDFPLQFQIDQETQKLLQAISVDGNKVATPDCTVEQAISKILARISARKLGYELRYGKLWIL